MTSPATAAAALRSKSPTGAYIFDVVRGPAGLNQRDEFDVFRVRTVTSTQVPDGSAIVLSINGGADHAGNQSQHRHHAVDPDHRRRKPDALCDHRINVERHVPAPLIRPRNPWRELLRASIPWHGGMAWP